MTTVVNLRRSAYDVYIGRPRKSQPPTKWGNPFIIGQKITARTLNLLGNYQELHRHLIGTTINRPIAIRLYRALMDARLSDGTLTADDFRDVHGLRLGCFCQPQPCHGDIIAQYAAHFQRHDHPPDPARDPNQPLMPQ